MTDTIPLVDFSKFAIDVDAASVDHDQLKRIGEEICKAFTQIGFCYIYNHGIPKETIQDSFSASRQFFEQPETAKQKYCMTDGTNIGWRALEKEKLNIERPVGDLKETYNFHPETNIEIVPYLKTPFGKLFEESKELAHRVLDTMSLAMGLPNDHFLRDTQRFIGTNNRNSSVIKTLYYPKQTDNIKPGQVRCGEHTDFGTLTFLFQDNIGGLEVMNSAGEYIPATPVEGAIVVNIGDLMQRWTADKMKATKHRVLVQEEEVKKKQTRQSIAFFLQPDDDVIIKCLDGSDKYEPITSKEYLHLRLASAQGY